jgi:hypothetical protein
MYYILFGIIFISFGCSKVEPVMSKAGVMTTLRCAKYSEELAVATCENRGGRFSGPSFRLGLGISGNY